MTIDTPIQVVVTSLAVVLVIIEFVPVLLYPARIRVFNPPVFMVKRHAVIFNMLVADIAGNLLIASFLVAWDAGTEHVGNQVYSDRIALLYALVALITLYLVFKMHLVGKFQVTVFFRDVVFHLYLHARPCMAAQTGLRVAGVKILHVTGKALCHLGPFWLKVFFIIVTGIAIIQAPLNVPCVAVMNLRFPAAAQQQEKCKYRAINWIMELVHEITQKT